MSRLLAHKGSHLAENAPQNNPQWQVWARRAGGWELLSPNFAGRKDLLAPGWLMELSGESLETKEPDMA